jgi:SAM-dependent methyltransferase
MGDKFRQINRYIEILDALIDTTGWTPGRRRRVFDMGSGKGYLTFATWHLLKVLRKLDVQVVGVEERTELAANAQAAAREHGCAGLEFISGRIAEVDLSGADAVIALHACNTATDDAIARGIGESAELILAAPCCHRELRPQIDSARRQGTLAPILRHGILRERFSEWLTDGLRALHLEMAGYDTQVIEFVPTEHTPKNLLIAAVKRQRPATPGLKEKIAAIKSQFGVVTHALDPLIVPEPGRA